MDLAKQAKIVDGIHDTLNDFVGQRLKVRANMGRSKIVESEGVLTQVHPQLFIMEVDRKRGRTARQSYQYVDVLTGMVELSQNGEPLFEPFIEETPLTGMEKPEDLLEERSCRRVVARPLPRGARLQDRQKRTCALLTDLPVSNVASRRGQGNGALRPMDLPFGGMSARALCAFAE